MSRRMRVLVAAIVACVPLLAVAGESEAVVEAFLDYKSAILDQRGEAAAGLVTKRSIDEYQLYVDWALTADRSTLESLSLINRFQVFLLKQRIPSETLSKLDGRSVFIYAVDQDWIGKNGVIRMSLGQVAVADDRASAEVVIDGKTTSIRHQFSKEKGLWKLDLVPIMRDTDQALQAIVKQQGTTENEFMFSMIETVSGRKVEESIWIPIQRIEPGG